MTAIDADGRQSIRRDVAAGPASMPAAEVRVERILREHGTALLNYFARRIPIAEDAADLLSETMLVLWRRQNDVPESDVEAKMWAYGVARHILISHRRSTGRQQALTDRVRLLVAESSRAQVVSPELGIEVEDVRAAVRALPSRDREIVMLVHWEGFNLAEVAQILAANPSSVRNRYTRARKKLASVLG